MREDDSPTLLHPEQDQLKAVYGNIDVAAVSASTCNCGCSCWAEEDGETE